MINGKRVMAAKNIKKIKVPTEAEINFDSYATKWKDHIFEIDPDNYCEGVIVLSSGDYEQFYEAVLLTEKCLYNNSGWDIQKENASLENTHTCEMRFKWSGTLSIYERITKNLKLPSGVSCEYNFLFKKADK